MAATQPPAALAPLHAAAAPEEVCGADYLRLRLARAQAVPAAERSFEVQAFIDGVALLRQIPALLPLTADGRPLLAVATPEVERRALQAFLRWAAADAATNESPLSDVLVDPHCCAYMEAMDEAAMRGWRPQRRVLGDALFSYVLGLKDDTPADMAQSVEHRQRALRLLQSGRDAARQLAEVAVEAAASEHPPAAALPSLQQLTALCHRGIVKTGSVLLLLAAQHESDASPDAQCAAQYAAAAEQLPPEQEAALEAALAHSCEALLALQPSSPTSWLNAGKVAGAQGRAALAVERFLRGAELARQQHADLAFATCGCHAGMHAFEAAARRKLPAGLLERATAVAAEVEPALKRATRLLPAPWVQPLEHGMRLLELSQTEPHQLAARSGMEAAMHVSDPGILCAGCGQRSAGLRRCGRCQSVSYCSPQCQRAHWRQHKPDCKPAGQ